MKHVMEMGSQSFAEWLSCVVVHFNERRQGVHVDHAISRLGQLIIGFTRSDPAGAYCRVSTAVSTGKYVYVRYT